MRRIIGGLLASLVLTGTLLVLPVYAAPLPAAEAVEPSIAEVELGSVDAPADEAVVTTDGSVVAAGADSGAQPGDVVVADSSDVPAPEETPQASAEATPEALPEPATEATPVTDTTAAVSGAEVAGVPALSTSQPEVAPFSAVGITWTRDPAVVDVTARIRVQSTDGTWGEWTVLTQDDIEQTGSPVAGADVRDGTAPYFTGPATGVEVVVQAADGAVPADVRTQLIDPGTGAGDNTLDATGPQDQAEAAGSMPAVFTRAQWGADESIRTWDPEYAPTIKAATIHHTADTNDYTADQVPAMMRSIYAFHTISRGWGDIGYNVIVDKFGRLWEGRYGGLSSTVIGAHAGGFNTGTFGVSMLGNYETAATPSVMIQAVSRIVAWKFFLYRVDPNGTTRLTSGGGGTAKYSAGTVVTLPTIFGHRDVGNTSCPGQYGYAQLGTIRAQVAAALPGLAEPFGSLDGANGGEGTIHVAGWVVDGDRPTTPVQVHVYVDGGWAAATQADVRRDDVAAAVPGAGAAHGFSVAFAASPGRHTVCAYGINEGAGTTNTQLGCRQTTVAVVPVDPTGSLDQFSVLGDSLTFGGWAVDPDVPTAVVDVHVWVDDRFSGAFRAADPRPDIAAARPGAGAAHGLNGTLTLPAGRHQVCFYAINQGAGSVNTNLRCATADVPSPSRMDPFGSADTVSVDRGFLITAGWVLDPDARTSAVPVHVYVDGQFAKALSADGVRPDIGGLYPAAGPRHGFHARTALAVGTHSVCLYAINLGQGSVNTPLSCSTVTVAPGVWEPMGALDGVTTDGRVLNASGWALDPDVPSAGAAVHFYMDGAFLGAQVATRNRPDVAGVVTDAGPAHGFYFSAEVPAGTHRVCAYAINTGRGSINTSLGCSTATMPAAAYNPFGGYDAATRSGSTVVVAGWAADPDHPTEANTVHVYVDGQWGGELVAGDNTRPDVAAARPGYGPAHGFWGAIPVSPGAHTVCVYAINTGAGTAHTPLGCRTTT